MHKHAYIATAFLDEQTQRHTISCTFGYLYVCSRGRSGQNQADQNLVSVKPTPIRSLGAPEASNSAYTTSKNHRLT